MSTLKVNNLQVGQSATATNNFTLYQPSTPDGTVRLGYGNTGSVTDALTFTNTGRLGIGVTNPDSLLHLKSTTGNVRHTIEVPDTFQAFTNYSAANSEFSIGYIRNSGSDHSFRFCAADGLSTGEIMRIDSVNSRVGIGTTIPSHRLNVNVTAGGNVWTNVSNLSTESVVFTNVDLPVVGIAANGAGSNGGIIQLYDRATGDTQIHLDAAPGQTPCWIINRNVGIGATNPTNLLTVNNTGQVADYVAGYFGSNALGAGESRTWISIQKGNLGANYGGAIGGYLSQGIGGGLIFGTQNSNAIPVERARIDTSGNVGIGITNPSSKLHVIGTTTIQGVSSGAVTKVYSYNGQPATGHTPGVYTFVRYLPVVSLGTQLRIPIPYQANYNSHSLVRVRGTSAIYNSRDSLYFDVSFGVGYLTVISNFTTYFQSGNIASITTTTGSVSAPHYVNINFTTAYTGATSNGINLWLEYFTAVEGYSIDVTGITLN